MDGERATRVGGTQLSLSRGWAGQPRTEATAVGACRAARPFSLIDALLITLIKTNIWGNQGSHEGGCRSWKTKKTWGSDFIFLCVYVRTCKFVFILVVQDAEQKVKNPPSICTQLHLCPSPEITTGQFGEYLHKTVCVFTYFYFINTHS